MPITPLRPCAHPRCPTLVERGYCKTHQVEQEHQRENWAVRRWYRTIRWKRLRLQVLADQAHICAECRTVCLDLEVHHIRKHHGNLADFFDRANLCALCKSCHSAKTAKGE